MNQTVPGKLFNPSLKLTGKTNTLVGSDKLCLPFVLVIIVYLSLAESNVKYQLRKMFSECNHTLAKLEQS